MLKKKLPIFFVIFFLIMVTRSYATGKFYIVKKHDTLWSISKKFYKNPFLWGKIWVKNTYINDPDLIFPGEILIVGKYGLKIYSYNNKVNNNIKNNHIFTKERKYVSAIWFNGDKFYSTCESHLCVWDKKDFRIATLSFDTYSHIEVSTGNTVYLVTKKESLPKTLYVYRKNEDLSHYNRGFDSVYLPIGEITVRSMVKKGVFKGVVKKSTTSISTKDVVSSVYPFEVIKGKPLLAHVGNIPVKEILAANNEFENRLGFFIFFKADRDLPGVVGKKVVLARLNKGTFEPVDIGEGLVVSQYKEYIGIFFPESNGLKEIPDRTQQYVLR